MKQALKKALLPRTGARTLPLGIGRGLRMHVDFQYQTRTYLGLYEIELNRRLRQILRPGISAFDVGGQHGYDALVIAKHTRARVASFECDELCLRSMAASFALNQHLAGLITPVRAFVGAGAGQLALDDYAYSGYGFVPDFVKIDIEGAELAALRSARRLLVDRRPAILVEVHSAILERECGRLLVNHGYRPLIVSQRLVWPDHRPTSATNRWLIAKGS